MTLCLDHLVIAVSDLPRTIADYTALGFDDRVPAFIAQIGLGALVQQVAIIADVNWQILEEHYDFRNYVIRNRIPEHFGDYSNQVLWRYKGTPAEFADRRFSAMNDWLAAVEADASAKPLRDKIVANKPAIAVDSCWNSISGWITGAARCNTALNSVFAEGVCDPAKRGRGQSGPPKQWLSYMEGPVGKPLGDAPVSR